MPILFKYNCFELQQLSNKKIIVTSIPFKELIGYVRFTYREPQTFDPFGENIKEVDENLPVEYYQRLTNDDRTKKIKKYLLKEINKSERRTGNSLASFPTALILASNLYDESDDFHDFENYLDSSEDDEGYVFLETYEKPLRIYFSNHKSSLIVDGQHRLAGMKKLYDEAREGNVKISGGTLSSEYPGLTLEKIISAIEKFHFLCTVLINFDLWEQGRIFVDVNFNQKPVNKSIYYDIFGSYPDSEKNEIYLIHKLALHLNANPDSVLKDKFRMLGTGKGLFSQAFFVEAMMPFFDKGNIWSELPYDYVNKGDKYLVMVKFMKAYFRSIKSVFKNVWPKDTETTSRSYHNILLKTTGMGALIKLIEAVYRKLILNGVDIENIDEKLLQGKIELLFKQIQGNENKYFSDKGIYSQGGGKGLQMKLYYKVGEDLGFVKDKKLIKELLDVVV